MQSPSTHESLLERLSTGEDPAAWEIFDHRYGALIRDYGRRRGLQPTDCDDLLQDVLLSLTRAMPGFSYDPSKGSLRGYLKTVAMRAISRRFGQKREMASLEQGVEPSTQDKDVWEAAWRSHHVRRALDRLEGQFPESTLMAFRHYVLEERSPSETAELLGISVDSVYQAKSRIMKRLSELIAEQVRAEG